MNQKKYVDIERLKEKYALNFQPDEHIVIEEKIDFSNSSFAYDKENDCLVAFSRKKILNEQNTLNGFWNFVQFLPLEKVRDIIGERYIVFGEWAGTPHSVKYPENVLKRFWMFDVYDKETEQYLPFNQAYEFFKKLELENFVPVFYDGPFISWEHVKSFVGRTDIGAEPNGEGIVIKRQDNLDSKSSNNPAYVKIVSEKFAEVHKAKVKIVDLEKVKEIEEETKKISTIVTPQRIEKMLYKLIDEGEIRQDWDEKDMRLISKILPKAIYEDCRKEENDIVLQCENFGKICSKLTMSYVREILNRM